ncbi:MAG: hypothetical protein ACRDDX_01675 [Cellulosilyticaceae bacterium]
MVNLLFLIALLGCVQTGEQVCVSSETIMVAEKIEEMGQAGEVSVLQREALEDTLRTIEETLGMTSQIQVLDLQYKEDTLQMNLSKELISYGGGNEAEYQAVSQLLRWGFEEAEAANITLLVEGRSDRFPEGTCIVDYTKVDYEAYYK